MNAKTNHSSDIHQDGLCNYKLRSDEIDEKQKDSS